MSEQPIHPIIMPKGTAIWVGPVNSAFPTMVDGEPYSIEDDGVTKWTKIGGNDGD